MDDVKIVDIAPGENKDKLMDGESQFVKILNDETEPITGTGTKDDPFVFLCDSSEGYVVAKGSFLNKMAQFNRTVQEMRERQDTGISWNFIRIIRWQIIRTESHPVLGIISLMEIFLTNV